MYKEKLCGIYCIENITDGKKYIGKSINIIARIKEHKRLLQKNAHQNRKLQRSWNKYGEAFFIFNVVELTDESSLNEKEVYYISKYNSLKEGFNLTAGGDGGDTCKNFTSYQKRKAHRNRSLASKGKINLGERNGFSKLSESNVKNICQLISDNTLHFDDIANTYQVSYTAIYNIYIGHTWKHISKDFIFPIHKRKEFISPNRKEVFQYDMFGNFVARYNSLTDAQRQTGMHLSSISQCCLGKTKSSGNFVWKYDV